MSVLSLHAGPAAVTALVVAADGTVAARGHRAVGRHEPGPGLVELSPDEIWRAALAAARQALSAYGETGGPDLRAVAVTNHRDTLMLWDQETLGSPRPAIAAPDRRAVDDCEALRAAGHEPRVRELTGRALAPALAGPRLRWLAQQEPNTWALVRDGRYAVGTVESYLVARMTRGTWHVTDVANASRSLLLDLEQGTWNEELCALFGVPVEALPDVVATWGTRATTEPRAFLGLSLPVSALAEERSAALVGSAGFEVGATLRWTGEDPGVLTSTGAQLVRDDGWEPMAAWRSPDGEIGYALTGRDPDVLPRAVPVTRVVDGPRDDPRDRAALGAAYLAGLA